jgi:hypothetical protein
MEYKTVKQPRTKAYTFCSRYKPTHEPKLQKEYAFLQPKEEFQIFFPHPSKKIKTPDPQVPTDRHLDRLRLGHGRRRASANSGLAKCGVQCLIEHLCIFHTFVLSESAVLLSPALRQAAKRYRQP